MIDILIDDDIEPDSNWPTKQQWQDAAKATFAIHQQAEPHAPLRGGDICLRLASNETVQALNKQWRHKDKVTDVLSFPLIDEHTQDFGIELPLGDIIIAMPFVGDEAKRLHLSYANHALHLFVHGCLHLLGYDHIDDHDARIMQTHENHIMQTLQRHTPYEGL